MAWTTEQYLEAIRQAEKAENPELAEQITEMMAESMGASTGGPMATLAHGATFGLSSVLLPGARETVRQYREREPGAAMGLTMLGGVPAGFGIGTGLGMGARAPGMIGRASRWLSQPRMMPQATLGAAEGAVLGASEAEPGERGMGALSGAGAGALFGGASAPVSARLQRWTQPGREAEQLMRRSIEQDLGRPATRQDYERFAQMSRERPELTMAEMPGMQTQALARTMTAMPEGSGLQKAAPLLRERSQATPQRLVMRLRELTGAEGDYYGNLRALGEQRARDAALLYEAAYDAPFEASEEIIDVLDRAKGTPWLRPAYNKARTLAYATDKTRLPTWAEFSKEVDEAGTFDLETFDWLKRGLDAQYQSLVRKSPDEARVLWNNIRRELVSELDEAVPQYAAARKAYAGPTAQMEAQEAGRNILKEDAGLTSELLEDMSAAEREAYVLGATEAIATRMRSRPRRTGGVPSIPEYVEDRMRAAFPDEDSFQSFLSAMDAEADMQGFKNMLLGRSPTADILTGQESLQRARGMAGAVGAALRGNFGEAGEQLLGAVRSPTSAVLPERIADPLTDMLFSQGAAVPPVMQRLQAPPVLPSTLAPMTTTQSALIAEEARRRLRGLR